MKVKKLADGTIQFQKDERDYEDVVYTVFFETNLLLLGLKKEDTSETVQFFYSMDTDKKYGTVHLPEDQKRFDAGEVLTLYPMDMTMDDYEVLCNEKLMFEMSGGQVMMRSRLMRNLLFCARTSLFHIRRNLPSNALYSTMK